MDTVEKVALTALVIVAIIVVLQRGQAAAQVVNSIGSTYTNLVKTLGSAPK